MKKHAYLIMAHNEFNILKKLILLLDDARNDIYVHVDKKSEDFDLVQYSGLAKKSTLIFVERTAVTWGAYSQINAELVLLRNAITNRYEYYHLLSGSDLPIKMQDEVHLFFEQHLGCEFLDFDKRAFATKNFHDRFQYYHFFQERMGKNRKGIYNFMNKVFLKLQQIFGINRTMKSKYVFNKGLNWFSITHNLANYVLSQEKYIKKTFKYSLSGDEVFIHTLVWNSSFKNQICDQRLRYTKKGRPYIFRADDFDSLQKSNAFWARKFSEETDSFIVDKIFRYLQIQ